MGYKEKASSKSPSNEAYVRWSLWDNESDGNEDTLNNKKRYTE